MRAGVALLALLCAGCFSGPSSSGEAPSETSFGLSPGEWRLLRPAVRDQGFDIDVDGAYSAPAYEASLEDSFACSAMAVSHGWVDVRSYRHLGAAYTGSAGETGRRWSSVAYGEISGNIPGSLAGGASDPWLLAAFDLHGPTLDANMTVQSANPLRTDSVGRFWCLDGPSRFTAGTYTVSNYYVDGRDLVWSETMSNGFLLRLQSSADPAVLEAHVEGPAGRQDLPTHVFAEGGLDATFCSTVPGTWTLAIDQVGTLVGTWHLTASVFDASVGWACNGSWERSDIDLKGDV